MSALLPIVARDPGLNTLAAVARRSFREGDDSLLVLVSSKDHTMSLHSRFGMGFFRLIAELLSR